MSAASTICRRQPPYMDVNIVNVIVVINVVHF